jgi:hypothetical protein
MRWTCLLKTTKKIYPFLHIWNKWTEIVKEFGSIVKGSPQQLTGLLCMPGSGYT